MSNADFCASRSLFLVGFSYETILTAMTGLKYFISPSINFLSTSG